MRIILSITEKEFFFVLVHSPVFVSSWWRSIKVGEKKKRGGYGVLATTHY